MMMMMPTDDDVAAADVAPAAATLAVVASAAIVDVAGIDVIIRQMLSNAALVDSGYWRYCGGIQKENYTATAKRTIPQ